MIARLWHGKVPAGKAVAYLHLMREVALPKYRDVQGNRGAWCLTRADGDAVHFEMLTFWDDVDAVKRFAGEQHEVAKYYDFDSDYLLEKEPHVLHYHLYER